MFTLNPAESSQNSLLHQRTFKTLLTKKFFILFYFFIPWVRSLAGLIKAIYFRMIAMNETRTQQRANGADGKRFERSCYITIMFTYNKQHRKDSGSDHFSLFGACWKEMEEQNDGSHSCTHRRAFDRKYFSLKATRQLNFTAVICSCQ